MKVRTYGQRRRESPKARSRDPRWFQGEFWMQTLQPKRVLQPWTRSVSTTARRTHWLTLASPAIPSRRTTRAPRRRPQRQPLRGKRQHAGPSAVTRPASTAGKAPQPREQRGQGPRHPTAFPRRGQCPRRQTLTPTVQRDSSTGQTYLDRLSSEAPLYALQATQNTTQTRRAEDATGVHAAIIS